MMRVSRFIFISHKIIILKIFPFPIFCSFFDLIQLMIFVDDAGGFLPVINHSPWNGLTLADFVMPFFLFIVGVSLALTYKVL